MIRLIATICAAAMAEPCTDYRLGEFKTMAQVDSKCGHDEALEHALGI